MSPDITLILQRLATGDRAALDELLPLVYGDLRRIARLHLRRERPDNTIRTTALVNEIFLRMTGHEKLDLEHRGEFFHLASRLMRRVLVDAARCRQSAKRGGSGIAIEFDEAFMAPEERQEEWIAVHEALEKFTNLDPARARIVEMRYFGGYTFEEIAVLQGVSEATIRRDWSVARLWLRRALELQHGFKSLEQGF